MRSPSYLIVSIFCAVPLAVIAADPPARPKVWAVVVGVAGDPARGGKFVDGAGRDARAVRSWLVGDAGWPAVNVLSLDDNGPEEHGAKEAITSSSLKATRSNLDWAVREWLAYRIRPGDVAVIYCAGVLEPGKAGSGALLQASRESRKPEDRRPWALDAALERMAARMENPILVLLDAPRPEDWDKAIGNDGLDGLPPSDRILASLTRWPGVSAWLSGRPKADAKAGDSSGFAAALFQAMGSAEHPRSVLGCLAELNRDERLVRSRFQVAGGIDPKWSLWPKEARDESRAAAGSLTSRRPRRSRDGARLLRRWRTNGLGEYGFDDQGLAHVGSRAVAHIAGAYDRCDGGRAFFRRPEPRER